MLLNIKSYVIPPTTVHIYSSLINGKWNFFFAGFYCLPFILQNPPPFFFLGNIDWDLHKNLHTRLACGVKTVGIIFSTIARYKIIADFHRMQFRKYLTKCTVEWMKIIHHLTHFHMEFTHLAKFSVFFLFHGIFPSTNFKCTRRGKKCSFKPKKFRAMPTDGLLGRSWSFFCIDKHSGVLLNNNVLGWLQKSLLNKI